MSENESLKKMVLIGGVEIVLPAEKLMSGDAVDWVQKNVPWNESISDDDNVKNGKMVMAEIRQLSLFEQRAADRAARRAGGARR